MSTFYQDSNGSDLYDALIPKIWYGEGTLWGWGHNLFGQLGTNNTTHRSSPIQTVAGGTNWKQVAGGTYYTGAIKTDGTLWMWGDNINGQLGDLSITRRSSPIQTVAGGTNWKQVDIGFSHTAAIKTDGTLWLWGENGFGQLGTQDTTHRSSPIQTVAGGTNWKQVACGNIHTGAIKTDGTLWMWGYNFYGALGTQDTTGRSSPIQTITGGTNWKQVAGGAYYTGAIKTDGTLWLWGENGYGQLGTQDTTSYSSPIQTITGGTNWKQVSCGVYHTGAIKTDGTLWLWGYNFYGQLGDFSITRRSSPIQTVAGGTNWKQVACGESHTGAIKTDGTLWMWGYNFTGQLGTQDGPSRSSPVQTIAGGTNWKQVACGDYHTGAVKDDGI